MLAYNIHYYKYVATTPIYNRYIVIEYNKSTYK